MPDVFISQGQEENQDKPQEASPIIPEAAPKTEAQKMKIPGHTHSRLSAFSLYPEDVDFETKESDEKIILLLRRHIVTNVGWILVTLLLIFVPGILGTFGLFSLLPRGFDLIITLAWYLFTFVYVIENFLNWYFNVYFVTDIRVIDVDFFNLIYKQVSDAHIDKIQDVTYSMGGVTRTLFNYGDVFIQTAAEVSEFRFEAVPNPDKVARILQDLIRKEEEKR